MQSRVLEQKLSFLQHLLDNDTEFVSKKVLESMSERITDLCVVRECKELEEVCKVECTERILMGEERWGRRMKETVRKVDHNCHLIRCHEKAHEIARVEEEAGW